MTPEQGDPIKLLYGDVTGVEVGGPGLVRSGGGIIGGGFGVEGAAEGMAIASVLNSLTSKVRIETVLNIKGRECGIVTSYTQETPDQLKIRMAGPLARIDAAQRAERAEGQVSVPDQLARLHELHAQGALTDDEYTSAKAKLIDRM